LPRSRDTQFRDTQFRDTQFRDTQFRDTQFRDTLPDKAEEENVIINQGVIIN
jgi:hypothetical protein